MPQQSTIEEAGFIGHNLSRVPIPQKLAWDIKGPLPGHPRASNIFWWSLISSPSGLTLSHCAPKATTLAMMLVDEIVCRYGVPHSIHSVGANLTSAVVSTLCSLLGMKRTQTMAYHLQGNGQVERFNCTLEAMLAKVVQANQQDLDIHLPKVRFAYHTVVNESMHFTLYFLVFGRSGPYASC